MEIWLFFLRWVHFLSGITWIGILYYFNFIQTPFFGETEAPVRSAAVQKLVPRALWWFRWGAMFTFLSGILIYMHKLAEVGGSAFYTSPYGLAITTGGVMGTLMFLNVWLIIWPNQQVVIASATQVAQGKEALPDAASRGQWAGFASRTNTLFSIPMLFFMGAASHFPSIIGATSSGSLTAFWIISLVIIGVVELNGLVGNPKWTTKKPLGSVAGTIWAGFILTAILYLLFFSLLR